MQAAKQRIGETARARRTHASGSSPAFAAADDTALLSALPIAAAIIGRNPDGSLKVLAHNSRFVEAVASSTCTAIDWDEAECLHSGPVAELFERYFADPLCDGELDFRDGEGIAARYLRIKLAPLPKRADRCRDA
jgi:hypothetical protein